MTTYAWPSSISPARTEWRLIHNTRAHRSPYTGDVQTDEKPGARWHVAITLPIMQEDDARLLIAFLDRQRGMANRFTLHDQALPTPRGVATGTPLVKGASQTGARLNTDGWTISQTGILKVGDMFGVNGELKRVVVDADSDVNGEATLTFEAVLRASPVDNAVITTASPTVRLMLADDAQAKLLASPGVVYGGITIQAEEAFT